MTQANVELVLALQLGPDVDLARVFRDGRASAAGIGVAARHFHADFECVHHLLGGERTYGGFDGFTESWLDWLAPWATYRAETEEAIDCGDRVLLLVRDFGRREAGAPEVSSDNAAIWTVREGKIARVEFYAGRDWARRDAGLQR